MAERLPGRARRASAGGRGLSGTGDDDPVRLPDRQQPPGRWVQGVDGLDAHNQENKVEPMRRALRELEAGTWFAGLRRGQAASRRDLPYVELRGSVRKVHLIADGSDRNIHDYLNAHDLPYQPLWEQGYVSIGDVRTTLPLSDVDDPADTRCFGIKRECGLHDAALDPAESEGARGRSDAA